MEEHSAESGHAGGLTRTDVVVAGSGPAGLTAALAFARLGMTVLCADPAPRPAEGPSQGADLRSTALMQPSRAFLERIGVWSRIETQATPLRLMRIVDAGGPRLEPRLTRDFDAGELGDQPFGWNVPNRLLRASLIRAAEADEAIDLRFGTAVSGVFTRTGEARVTLGDSRRISCRLLIAADGRDSPIRQAMGIGARTLRYGQKALAFTVTHLLPHDDVSTEIHRSGGPFTLVPLPDLDGTPCSAVIWMERGAEVERLHGLTKEEFERAATERSCSLLGPLTLASDRSVWPIIGRLANRVAAERTALIAEAAHVVPPIGAQGLNMSLADIETLYDLTAEAPGGLGGSDMLAAYQRKRWPEIAARVSGVDILNRASMTAAAPLRDARMQGLRALHAVPPVRRALMRSGLDRLL